LMEELRQIMERQVRQLTRLSDDLLDVGRLSQENLKFCREPLQLKQIIENAFEQVRPYINHCGHALDVSMPDEPIVVYGDKSRLLQVFANLLQNAAKFTEPNGKIYVALEPEIEHEKIKVRIRDNGCGIEKHLLADVLNGHQCVKGASLMANDGLGIGLKLVKKIVELHGGSVTSHSEGLRLGSEFTVVLPLY